MARNPQWVRCNSAGAACADVGGATAYAYSPVEADLGSRLKCRVTDDVTLEVEESTLTGVVTADPPPVGSGSRWFADDAWVNLLTPPDVAHDSNSALYVSLLVGDMQSVAGGMYANGLPAWSTTVYFASDATTTKNLHINNEGHNITIPWNPSWVPSPDSDAHLTVIDEAAGTNTSFQGFETPEVGGTGFAHGVTIALNYGDGRNTYAAGGEPDGGVGGVPQLSGLITPDDWAQSDIPHALKGSMPSTSAGIVFPATHTDGHHSPGVPFGARFSLPKSLDLTTFGLTAAQMKTARAIQNYCWCNTDSGGAVSMSFQCTNQPGVSYAGVSGPFMLPWQVLQHAFVIHPSFGA